jgi:hypothetical protein
VEFSKNFKKGRSHDIETVRILREDGHLILRPFFRKAWSFKKKLRWAGHPILRPFLRKAWSFLRILGEACHPIL